MIKSEFLNYLHDCDFGALFIECGWNSPTSKMPITIMIGETAYAFTEVAQQKGFRILLCKTVILPDGATRRQLDAQIKKIFHDYFVIFVSTTDPFHHLWSVPVKTVDKRTLVTVEYVQDDQSAFLLEKMN